MKDNPCAGCGRRRVIDSCVSLHVEVAGGKVGQSRLARATYRCKEDACR